MPTSQNHKALAKAIRDRRESLAISKAEACRRAERYDLECYPDEAGSFPGISSTAWHSIEQGERKARRAHTLKVVDAVLRWPEGTALAILNNEDPPAGQPVVLPGNEDHPRGDAAVVELAQAVSKLADVVAASDQQRELLEWLRQEVDHVRDRVTLLHMRMDGTA